MAKYFDKREGREKPIPDCARHGLMWNTATQRCEKPAGLGQLYDMAFLNGDSYEYGYYEPEPVYYEPPPAYEPPPEPTPAPAPIVSALVYQPPVYQPIPEPVYYTGPAYYEAPELFYYESPASVPTPAPVYVEPEPIVEEFFELPYVEPTLEPEPEEIFFRLPVGPEPEPIPTPIYSDWAFCANEYERCNFAGTREVRYGKNPTWTAPRQFTGGVDCSNAVFGDPLYGTRKECQTRAVSEPAIPEPVTMAEDFYIDDYGGGYYNGGGDYAFTNGDGFIDYAPYEPVPLEPPEFFPLPPEPISVGSDDLFLDYLSYYLGQGYDDEMALTLADQGAVTGEAAPIVVDTYREHVPEPVQLPDISPVSFPYIPSPFDPLQFQPPSIPFLPEPPPALPGVRLPPPCSRGTYHPHPIGHPQQDICVPFPPAPSPSQQQRPPQTQQPQTSAPRPPAQQQRPKPPAQQPCPTGFYRNPQTGQCVPIPRCATPGTVFDQRTGRCVPASQVSPLPIPTEAEDMLSDLKDIPWWVWAAGAGLLLLSQSGGDERTTTVRYRRAS